MLLFLPKYLNKKIFLWASGRNFSYEHIFRDIRAYLVSIPSAQTVHSVRLQKLLHKSMMFNFKMPLKTSCSVCVFWRHKMAVFRPALTLLNSAQVRFLKNGSGTCRRIKMCKLNNTARIHFFKMLWIFIVVKIGITKITSAKGFLQTWFIYICEDWKIGRKIISCSRISTSISCSKKVIVSMPNQRHFKAGFWDFNSNVSNYLKFKRYLFGHFGRELCQSLIRWNCQRKWLFQCQIRGTLRLDFFISKAI